MYTIVLFLHVIGVIGYCLCIGTWLFVLAGLRLPQRVEQVGALIHLNYLSGPFSGISALLLFASELYMALDLASGLLVTHATRTREQGMADHVNREREHVG